MSSQDPIYQAGRQAGQNNGNIPPKPTDTPSGDYQRLLDGYRSGQNK